MARRETQARLAYALVDMLGGEYPLEGIQEALLAALIPGTLVARYDRTWRLGPVRINDSKVYGRIGFQSASAASEIWDEARGDFVEIHPQFGQTTPYAIDLSTMRIVFQVRGQLIKPNTFRGNFQGLLREASGYPWLIRLEGVQQPPWEEWISQIDRLIELNISMHRPNPRYPGKLLEDFFEGAKLGASRVVLKARDTESIDINSSDFLKQSLQLAESYGSYTARGVMEAEDGEATIESWKSSLEGAAAEITVDQDPESREVNANVLDQALETGPGVNGRGALERDV